MGNRTCGGCSIFLSDRANSDITAARRQAAFSIACWLIRLTIYVHIESGQVDVNSSVCDAKEPTRFVVFSCPKPLNTSETVGLAKTRRDPPKPRANAPPHSTEYQRILMVPSPSCETVGFIYVNLCIYIDATPLTKLNKTW